MTLRRAPVLILAGLCVVLAARSCIAARDAEAVRAENARLRSEATLARLQASGYQTTLAHVTSHLRRTLAERDHWRALASEPDAEPVALVDAEATAEAHIEGPAVPVVDSASVPVGYAGEYADSTFALRWALLFGPPPRFEADIRARLPLELVGYRLPDGSYGVTAESPDPRIRIEVEDFYWQPPKQSGPSRWKWLLAGVAIGVAGWEMVR